MARLVLALVAVSCMQLAATHQVKKTLNFNMFLLRPKETNESVVLTSDGVSRFGPLLEFLVHRFQGLMSDRPQEHGYLDGTKQKHAVYSHNGGVEEKVSDYSQDEGDNEVDGPLQSRMPGVVVRPSDSKPGTFDVEINLLVDDGQPEDKKQ